MPSAYRGSFGIIHRLAGLVGIEQRSLPLHLFVKRLIDVSLAVGTDRGEQAHLAMP
jgi:hypothetical protein